MVTAKDAHTLVSYFAKAHKEKTGYDGVLNRHAARWGFNSMLMDMSMEHCKKVIDYYFETSGSNGYSLDWFLYNYEKLDAARRERDKDAAAQVVLREQSRRRAEEWRKKHSGNNGSQGS